MKYRIVFCLLFAAIAVAQAEEASTADSLDDQALAKLLEQAATDKASDAEGSEKAAEESSPPVERIGYVPEKSLEKFKERQKDQDLAHETEGYYAQAHEHLQKGFPQLAIKALHNVLKIKANHEKARILLGRSYVMNEEYAAAVQALMPLAKSKDSHWSMWYWLGVAFLKQNAYEHAKHCVDQALLLNPEYASNWVLRALIEQELDDHETALQLLSVANHHSPNNPTVFLNIALSNEALGNQQAAMDAYTRYLETAGRGQSNRAMNNMIMERMGQVALAK